MVQNIKQFLWIAYTHNYQVFIKTNFQFNSLTISEMKTHRQLLQIYKKEDDRKKIHT